MTTNNLQLPASPTVRANSNIRAALRRSLKNKTYALADHLYFIDISNLSLEQTGTGERGLILSLKESEADSVDSDEGKCLVVDLEASLRRALEGEDSDSSLDETVSLGTNSESESRLDCSLSSTLADSTSGPPSPKRRVVLLPLEQLIMSFTTYRNRDYWGPIDLKHITRSTIWGQFVSELRKSEREGSAVDFYFYITCTGYWIRLERARALTNAAYVSCVAAMLLFDRSAEQAWGAFREVTLLTYKDASSFEPLYHVSVLDCLEALGLAVRNRCYSRTFSMSPEECPDPLAHENAHMLDLDWIIDGKLLGFAGPNLGAATPTSPKDFLAFFRRMGITAVIRLNNDPITYDRQEFIDAGVAHYDLCYSDGGIPPAHIVREMLRIVDAEKTVALHCRMGVGRTGTLAAAYLMYKYRLSAKHAIAFTRMARSGCVVGTQQLYLNKMEAQLWAYADFMRKHQKLAVHSGSPPRRPLSPRNESGGVSPPYSWTGDDAPPLEVRISPAEDAAWSAVNKRLSVLYLLTAAKVSEAVFVLCMNRIDRIDLSKAESEADLLRLIGRVISSLSQC